MVRTLVAVGLVLGLLAGCAKDDGAAVRDGSGTGSSAAGGSSAAAGSSASGGSSAAAADCSPVGEDLESKADETVEVVLKDYSFTPSTIEVSAGVVTFDVKNEGDTNHELAFLPGGGKVPMKDGKPDEAALEEAGAFELEGFGPGKSCKATWELEAGTYTMFCIIELDDGTTHYMKGMEGTLTVT